MSWSKEARLTNIVRRPSAQKKRDGRTTVASQRCDLLQSNGVILLDHGEGVEGKPTSERQGELIKRRQVEQEMRRHDGVTEQVVVRVVLIVV